MKPVHKRLSLALAALVIAVGTYAIASDSTGDPATQATPAVEVETATVSSTKINEWHPFSGRLEAVDHVEIHPMVSGTIMAVHFKDGATVKKGDKLFTLDARPHLAAVERARAEVEAAQTNAIYAKDEFDRAKRLLDADALARKSFDERRNLERESKAKLSAAQASLRAAQVDLGYTEVMAPITGRVSRPELTVGNAVVSGANAPKLTTIVTQSPIYVSFNVDEGVYLRNLRNIGASAVPVEVALNGDQGYPHKGTISSVDNQVDATTGTIRVRALLENADGALIPGLFSRIRIGSAADIQAVLVDDAAIGTEQDKKFVYVVTKEGRAEYRNVTVGELHEGRRIVLGGLKDGETIVVNGVQRIRPNDQVKAASSTASAPKGKEAPGHAG